MAFRRREAKAMAQRIQWEVPHMECRGLDCLLADGWGLNMYDTRYDRRVPVRSVDEWLHYKASLPVESEANGRG